MIIFADIKFVFSLKLTIKKSPIGSQNFFLAGTRYPAVPKIFF